MTPIESIDFSAMEADVDEHGLIDPLTDLGDGLGVETRYAQLAGARTTETFAEFHGDYQDCYIAIRVPFSVLQDMLDHHNERIA
jgi:hypothetical protein